MGFEGDGVEQREEEVVEDLDGGFAVPGKGELEDIERDGTGGNSGGGECEGGEDGGERGDVEGGF